MTWMPVARILCLVPRWCGVPVPAGAKFSVIGRTLARAMRSAALRAGTPRSTRMTSGNRAIGTPGPTSRNGS